ncbi:MAG: Ig-like domain-containing protein, partial [Gemmatimonadaceae bacterium]
MTTRRPRLIDILTRPLHLRRRLTLRRALLATAYSLLVVSCDSPLGPDGGSVGRIEVTPSTLSLAVGDARSLSARVLDDAGNPLADRRVFWAAQDPQIATVTQSGIVTGIAPGNAQIGVSSGGKSTVVPVIVSSRPVSLVRVTPSAANVQAGATVTLTAQALDAAGATVAGRVVIWTTSNPAIATVTSTGVVTGVSAGNATISATVDDVVGSGLVTVQPVPVQAIALTPSSGALIVGRQLQLIATLTDAVGNAIPGRITTWSSSSPAIASVSSTGLVTALARGNAVITASAEGKSATASITVSLVPVDSVSVTPRTSTLAAGQTVQLTARLVDATGTVLTGRSVTWTSDQPSIATVSSSGLVAALTTGQARITATSEGASGTATVTVTPVAVASLSLTPSSATMLVGKTQQFTAVARDAQGAALPGRVITWISGAPSVATVTQTGLVTAVGVGSALIFAASEGISASVTVTVSTIGVALVRVQPATGSITQGEQLQLTATAVDGNGANIPGKVATWTSSNDAVMTVSSAGRVTGVAPGQVTITATIEGVQGTAIL